MDNLIGLKALMLDAFDKVGFKYAHSESVKKHGFGSSGLRKNLKPFAPHSFPLPFVQYEPFF